MGLKQSRVEVVELAERLSAEPLVGLKPNCQVQRLPSVGLSAEPLVGLKRCDTCWCQTRAILSAEPLVGLKQHRAVLYGAVLYGFQPNPSWV